MPDDTGFQLLPEDQKIKLTVHKREWPLSIILSCVFFVVIAGVFFWFNQSKAKAVKQISEIDVQLAQIEQQRNAEQEKNIVSFDRRLGVYDSLFAQHAYWTQGLVKLREALRTDVVLTNLSVDMVTRTIQFSAQSESHLSVAGQIASFYERPWVEKVNINGINSDDGKVGFEMAITFKTKELLFK